LAFNEDGRQKPSQAVDSNAAESGSIDPRITVFFVLAARLVPVFKSGVEEIAGMRVACWVARMT
jgi:hypothetical protein